VITAAPDFEVIFNLPGVTDPEGDVVTVTALIAGPGSAVVKIINDGTNIRLAVDMSVFYNLDLQQSDEESITVEGLVATLDASNVAITPGYPNVYDLSIEFLPRGEWIPPVIEAPEEEVFDAPIVLTRDVEVRIDQPVAVVEYGNLEEEFVREEPIVNEMKMDAEGNLQMSFSNDMDWPENWVSKAGETRNLQARELAGPQPFIALGILNADGVFTDMGDNAITITSMDPKNMDMKLNFENPEVMSLGSQFSPDQLVIQFPKDLVLVDKTGKSLILAGGEFGEGSVDLKLDIQPQLAKDSNSILVLKFFSTFLKWMGFIVPFTQLLFSYLFGAQFFYFFIYSMNIQNMSFLPALGVSNPS